ncbi:MAG TPA: hypothetical protein VKD91_06795 [Pyrinomonadaceae bacterium]|nr:hypothetical protein [Pyrinomonadaceae bacterium]
MIEKMRAGVNGNFSIMAGQLRFAVRGNATDRFGLRTAIGGFAAPHGGKPSAYRSAFLGNKRLRLLQEFFIASPLKMEADAYNFPGRALLLFDLGYQESLASISDRYDQTHYLQSVG